MPGERRVTVAAGAQPLRTRLAKRKARREGLVGDHAGQL